MEFEEFVYGILPLPLAISFMFWSIRINKEKKTKWKVFVAFIVLLMLILSVLILISMLLGAYPTFIPHILIGLVAVFLTIQQIFTSYTK